MKVLLGVTGSVAAKLTTKTVKAFQAAGHEVNVIITEAAKHFISYDFDCPIWKDVDEFPIRYDRVNDDGSMMIPHIYLKDWADALVIAPMTANTLAKIANGIADNLLTCTIRAWKENKPIIVAPAMNTDMWNHPATYNNIQSIQKMYNYLDTRPNLSLLNRIRSSVEKRSLLEDDLYKMNPVKRKFVLIYPVEKKLACGVTGVGAMANIDDIVNITNLVLHHSK